MQLYSINSQVNQTCIPCWREVQLFQRLVSLRCQSSASNQQWGRFLKFIKNSDVRFLLPTSTCIFEVVYNYPLQIAPVLLSFCCWSFIAPFEDKKHRIGKHLIIFVQWFLAFFAVYQWNLHLTRMLHELIAPLQGCGTYSNPFSKYLSICRNRYYRFRLPSNLPN